MNLSARVTLVQGIESLLSSIVRFLSSGSDIEIVIKSIVVACLITISMVVAVAMSLSAGLSYGRTRTRRNLTRKPQGHLESEGIIPSDPTCERREENPISRRARRRKHRRLTGSGIEAHPYLDSATLRLFVVIASSRPRKRDR